MIRHNQSHGYPWRAQGSSLLSLGQSNGSKVIFVDASHSQYKGIRVVFTLTVVFCVYLSEKADDNTAHGFAILFNIKVDYIRSRERKRRHL